MVKSNKRGRPKKKLKDKIAPTPNRVFRVPDDTWELWQQAAADAGKTFTAWSTEILTRAARRAKRE